MDWVGTLGGPLIVVQASIARRWRGANFFTGVARLDPNLRRWANPPDIDDYVRACAVPGWLGTVKVGSSGHGLILTGDRMPAAFLSSEQGGIIIRLSYADDLDRITELVRSAPDAIGEPTPYRLRVSRGGLLMFDSVYAGNDLPNQPGEEANVPWMRLHLAPDDDLIETATFEPDAATQLVLHRLKRDTGTVREL